MFSNMKTGEGLEQIVEFIEYEGMATDLPEYSWISRRLAPGLRRNPDHTRTHCSLTQSVIMYL